MPTETAQSLIVVPTCNGLRDLRRLVASLPEDIDLFVIDSSSSDGTGEYLQAQGIDHLVIAQSEFNHGATRQRALRERPGYAYYIYLTQDACLAEPQALERLLAHFEDPQVGAVCGRQLPHPDANPLAAHARYFNYPAPSRHKRLADAEELGVKAAFMSNSFSAYRADALQAADGFPAHVILAEDMYVAARMLQKGWTVAYAGDACCHHSHNYTPWQEFKRYFDTGVFHASEPWIQDELGGVSGEGRRFVLSELRYLGKAHRVWWPASMLATAMKLVGYHLGKRHSYLPPRLRQAFSMHRGYWN
ncbi:glycosyltransferase [Halomonas piscis]|uniref:Glycosyltransferase n=1 Tax=Halomonas piscis TaxID=3031727 RepID=A0ABY9Z3D2_9GAMM|nr:glycosyltransferase [Halomonas piscis]WNK21200.1 glycosyltransferase [Halomonas piscis]